MAGENASSLQVMQLGIETTRGTIVAANRLIDAWTFKDGAKIETMRSAPSGRKYDAGGSQAANREWMEFAIDSPEMDYNSMIYLISSVYDAITPGAHGSSSVAKDWSVTPPVASAASSKTYSFERGSSTRAHKFGYGLINKFSYKHDRKSASCSASGFGQQMTDGITLTSSPTRIPVIPMSASHFNIYLDTTSGGLGTTQLTKFISHEHTYDSAFNPVWFVNRANASISSHVDMKPKTSGKLLLEADSTGMALLNYIRLGTTLFMRVEAQGLVIDNLQIVSLGSPSAGNFTLTYKAQTTGNIVYTASAATVQTALEGLSTLGVGNVTVTGSAGGPYSVVLPQTGTLGQDVTAMTGSGVGLTGGTFLITPSQSYDKFVHDMAINISAPSDFADSDGVFAVPWDYTVVEDATWSKAQILTTTNLLTAL
jgi:hypothetical protein